MEELVKYIQDKVRVPYKLTADFLYLECGALQSNFLNDLTQIKPFEIIGSTADNKGFVIGFNLAGFTMRPLWDKKTIISTNID